jgi:lipoprotein-releasing system permease protein
MNLSYFIARRYLFSRRKKNFINFISILSLVGVAFSTAALIIILSVFNGLEDLLRSLNNSFDPQIKIEAVQGKSFPVDDGLLNKIKSVDGVDIVTEVIEDYAYLRYRDGNQVVKLKGVSDNYLQQQRIDDKIVEGELRLKHGDVNYAILGVGVQYALSVPIGDDQFGLQVYYINNVQSGNLDPSRLYSQKTILPGASFSILQNFDENYVIVPLSFAQELMKYENRRTSLEIKVKPEASLSQVQSSLRELMGESFSVLNHEEQHKDIYRLLKMEKLFTFLAFSLLLGISALNIFFSLMMLVLDKKKDIAILAAMGASQRLIRNVFLKEGAMIALAGTTLGLVLGGAFCWVQSVFGVISMGMASAVSEGYPIKIVPTDFLYTMLVVALITMLVSFKPAIQASRIVPIREL